MYCHTSSSVQLLIGNTLKCSPKFLWPLNIFHNSGLWFLGSHCPNSFRCEKKRSFALAFSSSRLPPPIATSIFNSSILSRSVTDCALLRLYFFPFFFKIFPCFF